MAVGPVKSLAAQCAAAAAAADANSGGVVLDETAFPNFQVLVLASQDYARFSGCRFRSADFEGLPAWEGQAQEVAGPLQVGEQRSKDRGPLLASKLRLAPAARAFAERLRAGDPQLLEDLERAHHTVMEESVRNAMVATFQRLGQWPPSPSPAHISPDDCNYEDVSAPMDELAQRTYNDAMSRACPGDRRFRAAMTATFLVDFAQEAGCELPPMPQTQRERFQRFADRVAEMEDVSSVAGQASEAGELSKFEQDSCAVLKFLSENKKSVALAAAGVLTVGPVVTAGIFLARRTLQQRKGAQARESDAPAEVEASASVSASSVPDAPGASAGAA